jgi:beta-glucosidase
VLKKLYYKNALRIIPGIDKSAFGATITGTFVPDVTGDWQFGLTSIGPAVLRVNGKIVCDLSVPQVGGSFFGEGSPEVRNTVELERGVPCEIDIDYSYREYDKLRALLVGVQAPHVDDTIAEAVEAAAAADVAIVVVGTNEEWETEGEDRVDMDLPGRQDELIARVAAANPNTIVVINAGSPVSMPWLDDVAAVLQVWFPGEEFGEALADMLLGVAEPGGRLPLTIPRRLADTPAFQFITRPTGQLYRTDNRSIGSGVASGNIASACPCSTGFKASIV